MFLHIQQHIAHIFIHIVLPVVPYFCFMIFPLSISYYFDMFCSIYLSENFVNMFFLNFFSYYVSKSVSSFTMAQTLSHKCCNF